MGCETKEQKAEKERCIGKLREWLPPGSTVSTVLLNVSRSGMSREIKCLISAEGEVFDASYFVARALGERVGKRGGVIIGGAGMDMGFAIVHSLSYTLHGTSNHEAKDETRSGYTIKHRWL